LEKSHEHQSKKGKEQNGGKRRKESEVDCGKHQNSEEKRASRKELSKGRDE
jgi:hypothetical protein